jgi:mannose-6-phosphate isomerase-like protein (cupin superfamily)
MSLVGLVLDDGNVLLKFVTTAAESGGALHAQEARYAPRSRPPPYHFHPRQDERFQILEGSLRFHIDGADRTVGAGEELAVPRGVAHRAHNPGDAPAVVLWETRPALRTAEMFRALYGMRRPRPGLLEAAAILHEYRHEMVLAGPLPRRVVIGCLGPVGRLLHAARGADPR